MLERIANILRQYHFARRIYRIMKRIDFSYSIPQITPINVKKSRFDFKRINLVLPSINKEHFFGGVSTALHLLNAIADLSGEKIHSRIILTDAVPDKDDLKGFPEYRLFSFEDDSDALHQVVPVTNKYQRNVYVTMKDRFLATSWWTAFCTIAMVGQQSNLCDRFCNRMGYLIQDFEPGFYNWSTHFVLAESTYRSNVLTLPVFNSSFLKEYFRNKGYRFEKEFVFEPRLNQTLKKYFLSPPGRISRDKRILVYGRPSVERNCFPLIVEALRIWASHQPNLNEWEIVSIGENHKTVPLGNGKALRSLGKLSLESYAILLSQSAVGLSLMVSPHPSYPPLEMAHFGLLTITNSYANKDLSQCHENILSLDVLTPDRVANAILKRTDQFSADPRSGLKGKSLIPFYYQDAEAFPFAEEFSTILFNQS